MSKLALPLQLLLAFALVLNGIGGAMAGVLAALPAGTPASAAMAASHDAAGHGALTQGHDATAEAPVAGTSPMQLADCGGHHDPVVQTPAAAQPTASDCHAGDDDCGESPECRQACLHASVAVPPQLHVGVIQSRAEAILHPLASGHPAPSLGGLIRPPIA